MTIRDICSEPNLLNQDLNLIQPTRDCTIPYLCVANFNKEHLQEFKIATLLGERRPLGNHVLSRRASADPSDGHADKLLDELDVGARLLR